MVIVYTAKNDKNDIIIQKVQKEVVGFGEWI